VKKFNGYWTIFILLMVGFLLTGCGENNQNGNANVVEPTETETTEDVMIEAQPVESVGPGEYLFPEQFVNLGNPVPADEDSQAKGAGIYDSSCERCHGAEGKGDGTSAVQNDLVMIDFNDEKIAALSDGELFYIISYGVAETPMEGWDLYNEELRWHLVNYIRTLQKD